MRLIALARVSRLGMAPLTMSVPIMGALTTNTSLLFYDGLWLAIVGLCAHIFGFGLNDIIDFPLDKSVGQRYPLISVTRWQAWAFVSVSLPVSFFVYLILLNGSDVGLIVLCSSVVFSVVYNKWSKWGKVPSLVAEQGLAMSIGLLCLSGSLINNIQQLTIQSVVFSLTLGFILLLLNSVPSGLKDIKTDSEFGARSFVIATSTKMLDDDEIFISNALRFYSIIVQGILFVLSLVLVVLFDANLSTTIMIVILSSYAALHLRMILAVKSFQALRQSMPLLSGYFNFAVLLMIVVDRMSIVVQFAVVLYVCILFLVPLRIGFRVWRQRYATLRR